MLPVVLGMQPRLFVASVQHTLLTTCAFPTPGCRPSSLSAAALRRLVVRACCLPAHLLLPPAICTRAARRCAVRWRRPVGRGWWWCWGDRRACWASRCWLNMRCGKHWWVWSWGQRGVAEVSWQVSFLHTPAAAWSEAVMRAGCVTGALCGRDITVGTPTLESDTFYHPDHLCCAFLPCRLPTR